MFPIGLAIPSLLLSTTLAAPAQTPPAAASMLVCVADTTGFRMKHATIVVQRRGFERTTTADDAGCYRFDGLLAGTYRVTARMLGFDNATQDRVSVAPGKPARVDLVLPISRMCDCVTINLPHTLSEAWDRADAVIYVRLSDGDPATPAPPHFYRHAGTVLDILKGGGQGLVNGTTTVLEHQENQASPPAAAGQHVVLFARWWSGLNGFVGLGIDCCGNPETAFVVENGRIRRAPAPLARYVGMKIETFVEEVRAVAGRR